MAICTLYTPETTGIGRSLVKKTQENPRHVSWLISAYVFRIRVGIREAIPKYSANESHEFEYAKLKNVGHG